MILLPVRGDGGQCDRALGCLVTVGPVGRTPRRFAIARQVTEAIDAPTRAAPAPAAPVLQPGFAEPAPTFAAPRPNGPGVNPRRAHLRLVKSDD